MAEPSESKSLITPINNAKPSISGKLSLKAPKTASSNGGRKTKYNKKATPTAKKLLSIEPLYHKESMNKPKKNLTTRGFYDYLQKPSDYK